MPYETRSYVIGPMDLEEWIYKTIEADEIVASFKETYPNLNAVYEVITTDYPDMYYIQINISERKNIEDRRQTRGCNN